MTQPPEDERPVPDPSSEPPPGSPPAEPAPTANPLISADPLPTSGWTAPAAVPVHEVAPGLVFADTASRLVAFIVDAFIVGLVSAVIGSMLGMGQRITADDAFGVLLADYDYTIATTVVGLVYFVGFWTGGRRATPGQRAFGLQVGNAFDGRPLTLEQAIRRWLGYGTFLVLFTFDMTIAGVAGLLQVVWVVALLVSTATSPTKQGLHDRLANTAVVRPAAAGRGAAITCLVLIIAMFVLAIAGFAAFLGSEAGQEILRRAMERV